MFISTAQETSEGIGEKPDVPLSLFALNSTVRPLPLSKSSFLASNLELTERPVPSCTIRFLETCIRSLPKVEGDNSDDNAPTENVSRTTEGFQLRCRLTCTMLPTKH